MNFDITSLCEKRNHEDLHAISIFRELVENRFYYLQLCQHRMMMLTDRPVNIQHDRYRIQQNKTTPTTIQGVLQYESYSQCNFSRDNFGSKRLYEHIRIFQNKPFSRCMQTDFFFNLSSIRISKTSRDI